LLPAEKLFPGRSCPTQTLARVRRASESPAPLLLDSRSMDVPAQPLRCPRCDRPLWSVLGTTGGWGGGVRTSLACPQCDRVTPVSLSLLSGLVTELGEGFIVLGGGTRIVIPGEISAAGIETGTCVTVTARRAGVKWIAEQLRIER
jgi:hypothetical protein